MKKLKIKFEAIFFFAYPIQVVHFLFFILPYSLGVAQTSSFDLKIEQLTSGTKHHLFGYIGQCQTIPWNSSDQYILGLEIESI